MSEPKCPSCGVGYGDGLWDDNLWEGCNRCGYLFNVDEGWKDKGGDPQKIAEYDKKVKNESK